MWQIECVKNNITKAALKQLMLVYKYGSSLSPLVDNSEGCLLYSLPEFLYKTK